MNKFKNTGVESETSPAYFIKKDLKLFKRWGKEKKKTRKQRKTFFKRERMFSILKLKTDSHE